MNDSTIEIVAKINEMIDTTSRIEFFFLNLDTSLSKYLFFKPYSIHVSVIFATIFICTRKNYERSKLCILYERRKA